MVHLHNDSSWTGFLRFTFPLLCALLVFSVVTFCLAVSYVTQLYKAPLDHSVSYRPNLHHWSAAWFIFFAPFLPFISTVHSIVALILFARHRLNPIYGLTGAIVFFVTWCLQMWIWWDCSNDGDYDMCWQSHIVHTHDSDWNGSLAGVSNGVNEALLAFGMLVLAMFLFYIPMAAVATHRVRMAKRIQSQGTELKEFADNSSVS